jgi:hypothetical protein
MPTGNVERMQSELVKAADSVPERFPGYRARLIEAAMECITATSEHDDRRTNIKQRFDGYLEALAKELATPKGDRE